MSLIIIHIFVIVRLVLVLFIPAQQFHPTSLCTFLHLFISVLFKFLIKLEFYRTHTLCALSTDCTVVAYAWRDHREPLPVHVTRQILGTTTHLLTCVHVDGCRNNLVATLPGPPETPGTVPR